MSSQLTCTEVIKSYQQGDNKTEVLKGLSLDVKAGEMVAIVGSSGCGKSTFLHIAGGLDKPTSGSVEVSGADLSELSDKARAAYRNQHIGFIYQFHHLMMEFSALENVAMPLLIRKEQPKVAREKAIKMLEKVGLSHRVDHQPSQLSGGERQRVAIARALITEPSIVLADEPTGNLDAETAEQVFDLILALNNEVKTSFVIVTHDLDLANKMDRQLKLEQGRLVELSKAGETVDV
jgi:lipoprotein-releasing system ATP-binding protein